MALPRELEALDDEGDAETHAWSEAPNVRGDAEREGPGLQVLLERASTTPFPVRQMRFAVREEPVADAGERFEEIVRPEAKSEFAERAHARGRWVELGVRGLARDEARTEGGVALERGARFLLGGKGGAHERQSHEGP